MKAMLRRLRVVLLAVALGMFATAQADEIRVAVAANFARTLDALAARYEAKSPHRILASSGSTGSHYAQIVNGAPFDMFLAADRERPERLERQGLTVTGSRFTYAVGRLALWSPRPGLVDSGGKILASGRFRHLAIANPELAPYGAAARTVLERLDLWHRLEDRLVVGQDIGQTYAFVRSGNAELGFVAYSQLARPGAAIDGSVWLVPQSLHAPIEQQAVLLEDRPAARDFFAFLASPEAKAIIASYGYGT